MLCLRGLMGRKWVRTDRDFVGITGWFSDSVSVLQWALWRRTAACSLVISFGVSKGLSELLRVERLLRYCLYIWVLTCS